jgi:hypothetical protein
MANNIQIVGGERSGDFIKWFGNRVRIQGKEHVLNRVIFTDGSRREYYVKRGMALASKLDAGTVARIEVCQ